MAISSNLKNNKLFIVICLAIFLASCTGQTTIQTGTIERHPTTPDPRKTPTGFYWPTDTIPHEGLNNWLAHGCDNTGDYFDGLYHIGDDILATAGEKVYAISDGTVLHISKNGWGEGNVGVIVAHKLENGDEFIAIYGHVQTSVSKDVELIGGQSFATIGSYPESEDHLHFGIRPGLSINAPYGRLECPNTGDTNGFVDPVNWITTQIPARNAEQENVVSGMEISNPDNNGAVTYEPGLVIANEFGSETYISRMEISKNGRVLAVHWHTNGSFDSKLRLYEPGTFELISEISLPETAVFEFSISPDGKRIATGGYYLVIRIKQLSSLGWRDNSKRVENHPEQSA
jgi:hypothetical protein